MKFDMGGRVESELFVPTLDYSIFSNTLCLDVELVLGRSWLLLP